MLPVAIASVIRIINREDNVPTHISPTVTRVTIPVPTTKYDWSRYLFCGCALLYLPSPKGGCFSISYYLSCSWRRHLEGRQIFMSPCHVSRYCAMTARAVTYRFCAPSLTHIELKAKVCKTSIQCISFSVFVIELFAILINREDKITRPFNRDTSYSYYPFIIT